MKQISPKVTIIILNWNGLKDTRKCLNSLKEVDYSNYEILLVDNNSKDREVEILKREFGEDVNIIENETNLGFAEGNNVGIRKVINKGEGQDRSKYILTLNNDTVVEQDFLDKLVKCAEKHPSVGSIQPKMILGSFPELIDSAGLLYSKNGLGFNRGGYESVSRHGKESEILGCCAGASLYRTKALKDVEIEGNYFDKDFFVGPVDFDLSFRLQWAEWESWYCPNAIVYHYKGAATGTRSNFITYYRTRNQVWVWVKNLPLKAILKNFHWLLLGELGQVIVNSLRGQWVVLKAKFDAYRNIGKFLKKKKKIKKKVDFKKISKWFTLKWRIDIPEKIIDD